MLTNPKNPKSSKNGTAKAKKQHLFLNFSLLSFSAFIVIGYFVVSAIRPAILNFVVSRQEADTVVFVNRLANNLLLVSDFTGPTTAESEARLSVFTEGLQVPARLAVFVTNKNGLVLSSDIVETMGGTLKTTLEFERASKDRRSVAVFKKLEPEEKELLGTEEAFELFIPITFGVSGEVVGVMHSLSRTSFIRDTARMIERDVALRIAAGLLFLYFLLSVIVWRASKTIRTQADELYEYATTLETKVKERTRDFEESAKRELEAAREVARLKDEFVFVAAHELRTPLTAIKWSIDALESDKEFFKSLSQSILTQFSTIKNYLGRLMILINDLLNVARLESGTITFEKKPIAIPALLVSTASEFRALAEKNNISLYCEIKDKDKLPFLIGDEIRLREVLNNLIANAIKFNHSGGSIECVVKFSDLFAEISIKDTGAGIKKENMAKVFTKFFREREDIEGTGLGLWISKEIMRRMGGDITVDSEEGKGSMFTVKIPMTK